MFIDGEEEAKKEKSILNSPLEFTKKIYEQKGVSIKLPSKQGADSFVTSKSGIRTNFGIYNQDSNCLIDVNSNADFNEKIQGKVTYIRIVVSDFSSFASRNECVKSALDQLLPIILNEGYASILKAKIYEEGTINKEFSKEQLEAYAKTLSPVIFDGGFLFESLNVGVLSTPSAFEVHMTDCSNVKCGE